MMNFIISHFPHLKRTFIIVNYVDGENEKLHSWKMGKIECNFDDQPMENYSLQSSSRLCFHLKYLC
jgi:hypothetical protein